LSDIYSAQERSQIMGRVRARGTAPELAVRKVLHAMGFRFRLHRHDLPGRPDIVLPKHRVAIFVHGCFWHGHNCPKGARPSSNKEFWTTKLDRNLERDAESQRAIQTLGWHPIIVWECQTKPRDTLETTLLDAIRRVTE
jgi:DNA mismatch endonuclease, patch repair protein